MLDTKIIDESGSGEDALGLACAERVGALLEGAEAERDAELWARRLAEKAARDDALNVAGMLAAAGAGGGARLADSLAAGGDAGARLRDRLSRYEELLRGAPDAVHARTGAARAEANARRLLHELETLMTWLDAELLETEPDLGTPVGRARALQAAEALRTALRTQSAGVGGAAMRLAAVRERLRKLGRARERLAAALGRHLNNLLIHRGNEAAAGEGRAHAHHSELLQYAPFMRWLKEMDEKTYDALVKVYVSTWSRVYEREVRAASEAARAHLQAPDRATPTDLPLDNVLTLVETICNAEQDFCAQFFFLDVDVKSEGSDGERSERSEGDVGGGARRAGVEARRLQGELFPALETELVALVQHMERVDPYGAMRALACVGRRVLTGEGGGAGGALAAAAVAAKRGADRAVAERAAALGDAVRSAARRPRCGLFSFLQEFEELSAACEAIFVGGRRADLERWYVSLAGAMLAAVAGATHPRTPRYVIQLENYHRLHRVLSALRVPQLEPAKREAKARYTEALRAYVTSSFGQPLEKLQRFFEGVAEAVAGGARESEVCYRQAFSKHELRKVLALYPAHEVRKSLGRLYRTVEKQLSEEGGLLQVVWRALQEEFIAQHHALQARIAACYPGAGLALPLTTQDILDAFSDIAQEH